MITKEQLSQIYKEASASLISKYIEPLNRTLERYEINTPQRMRMFLAQVGHESGQLRYSEELASGQDYENRSDLGNTQPGDGPRYKGRGLIQLTGRRNYQLASIALDEDLVQHPELLSESPEMSCLVAGWYWANNNLNSLADMGMFEEVTRRINGGLNGYADRYKLYQRALEIIPG